jgi:hypothetical protein
MVFLRVKIVADHKFAIHFTWWALIFKIIRIIWNFMGFSRSEKFWKFILLIIWMVKSSFGNWKVLKKTIILCYITISKKFQNFSIDCENNVFVIFHLVDITYSVSLRNWNIFDIFSWALTSSLTKMNIHFVVSISFSL